MYVISTVLVIRHLSESEFTEIRNEKVTISRRKQYRVHMSDEPNGPNAPEEGRRSVRRGVRDRQRAVAEREASRLARPDRPVVSTTLHHVPKERSNVSSTPAGYGINAIISKGTQKNESYTPNKNTTTTTAWCGPFTVARQMIAQREEARRKRESTEEEGAARHPLDEAVEEVELEEKRCMHPSMKWKGQGNILQSTNENLYSQRKRRLLIQQKGLRSDKRITQVGVPTLFRMCVNYIVENFEYVESLGLQVDSSIRTAICESLVAAGKMNGAAFDTLAEKGLETLEIIDCVEVSQDQLIEALELLIPAGLKALLLNHCGRSFSTRVVDAIVKECNKSNSSQLFAISLGGAYLLKDADSARMIAAVSKSVSSLEFKACSLLGPEFCLALGTHFSSKVGINNLLELSLEALSLSKSSLLYLGQGSDAFRNLKSLSLCRIEEVDDEVMDTLLQVCSRNLEILNLKDLIHLSDETLNSIRRCNSDSNLKSLQISGSKGITAAGLETFFTRGIDNLCEPPALQMLDLSNCERNAVTDDIIGLASFCSACKNRNDANGSTGLVELNVSGSLITDKTLEKLAETCSSSLKILRVNFCPNLSNQGLGYLVSKLDHLFSKLEIWGNAQITDEFLDRHDRITTGGLEIIGAWMKQSGKRSSR